MYRMLQICVLHSIAVVRGVVHAGFISLFVCQVFTVIYVLRDNLCDHRGALAMIPVTVAPGAETARPLFLRVGRGGRDYWWFGLWRATRYLLREQDYYGRHHHNNHPG